MSENESFTKKVSMDKKYYEEYYHLERNHWFFTARLNILESQIKKHISRNPGKVLNILNIGVATGATSQMLDKYGTVTSLEYDKDCCQLLEEKTGIKALNASILELPFEENSFDLICCFDVIEHIEDDQTGVNEMLRVCRENGHVFVTVPAFMFLWSHHDEINHHFRRYTRKNLLKLFETLPLKVVFNSYFNFFLFFPIALFRLTISKLLAKKQSDSTGSDFEIMGKSGMINSIFYKIFNVENPILKSGLSLPVGVSLMAIVKKLQK